MCDWGVPFPWQVIYSTHILGVPSWVSSVTASNQKAVDEWIRRRGRWSLEVTLHWGLWAPKSFVSFLRGCWHILTGFVFFTCLAIFCCWQVPPVIVLLQFSSGESPFPSSVQFSSVQFLSRAWLFVTPWTAAHQASLSITNSQSFLKLMSIESVMPSNHLILYHPLLPPSIFPSIRVFSNESVLHIRWPKYGSFSFSTLPMNIQDWFPLGWTGWISSQSKGLSRVFSNTTFQKHQSSALSFLYSSTLTSINDYWKSHSFD